MFNLEEAIADWRRQMAARGISIPAVLNELESHLREDIHEQLRLGLDLQQAFEAAVKRLGKAELLRSEFAKASLKRTSGWFAVSLKLAVFIGVAFVLFMVLTDFRAGTAWASTVVGGVAVALFVIFGWRYAVRRFDASFQMPSLAPDAIHTLEIARQEASRYRHDFVGTEHLLLGLLEKGIVPEVLRRMGVEGKVIRQELENLVPAGPEHNIASAVPYTPRAERALQLASEEAKEMQQHQIRPECVLLGLLLEENGAAGRALKNLGVDFQRTRAEILKMNKNTG